MLIATAPPGFATNPTMPCGKAITSTTMAKPSSARQYSEWRISSVDSP